jgi:hypothetical protein
VHPGEHSHTLEDEYEQAAGVLAQLRDAVPDDCRLHWMIGNHECRMTDADSRRTDPKTRSLLHWSRTRFAAEFDRWTQYPYRKPSVHDQSGVLRLGQVCFVHGYEANKTSDNSEAQRIRYALGGVPNLLVVRGHTHQPRPVAQCRAAGGSGVSCWYANAGTLGPLQPHYMERKDVSDWGAGVVFGRAKLGRISRMRRREWKAQCVLISELEPGEAWMMTA